jgi:hypothetical protein
MEWNQRGNKRGSDPSVGIVGKYRKRRDAGGSLGKLWTVDHTDRGACKAEAAWTVGRSSEGGEADFAKGRPPPS